MSIYSEALKFYFKSKTIYRVHSPYLFELSTALLDDRQFYAFAEIEAMRKSLLNSTQSITMIDLGVGSRNISNTEKRKISAIAKTSLSSPWQCKILFKLLQFLKPSTFVEIGSSLGISSAYLGSSAPQAQGYALEGNPDSLIIAKNVSRTLKIKNIEFVEGNFNQTLPSVINQLNEVEFVFFDGNHRKEATLNYFEMVKPKTAKHSILVFDDIYWSKGMKESWEQIKKDPFIQCTVDFFYFGLAIVNNDFKEKVNLRIIDKKFKPWQKFI